MHAHWAEVGHYKDLRPDPDLARFAALEANGVLRIYTARAEHLTKDSLRGYAIHLISADLLFRTQITTQPVALYLYPSYRHGPTGGRFIRWIESKLAEEGVTVFMQAVSTHHPRSDSFVRLLQRQGYELHAHILSRRVR